MSANASWNARPSPSSSIVAAYLLTWRKCTTCAGQLVGTPAVRRSDALQGRLVSIAERSHQPVWMRLGGLDRTRQRNPGVVAHQPPADPGRRAPGHPKCWKGGGRGMADSRNVLSIYLGHGR